MSGPRATRRAILAGLVAAPGAGLPALADAIIADSDPILVALAEVRVLRAREDAAREAYERAEAACSADPDLISPCSITFNGAEFRTLEYFDRECQRGALSLWADSPRVGKLRAELQRRIHARDVVYSRHGLAEAAAAYDSSGDDRFAAEELAVAMTPVTPAGAMALLGLVAERIDARSDFHSEEEAAANSRAIRRARTVLEAAGAKGAII